MRKQNRIFVFLLAVFLLFSVVAGFSTVDRYSGAIKSIDISIRMALYPLRALTQESTTQEPTHQGVTTEEKPLLMSSTSHTHSFTTEVVVICHPQEGHYETICTKEAYVEEIYENYGCYCYSCGEIMDSWSGLDIMAHSSEHGAYGSQTLLVDVIEYEAVYEEVWVVDKEEYYEEVVSKKCYECGYAE